MRIIDADNLKLQISETYEYEFPTASGAFDEFVTKIIPNIINNATTIDAAPVVRGEWERMESTGGLLAICSACKYPVSWWWHKSRFCPSCGAKMESEGNT